MGSDSILPIPDAVTNAVNSLRTGFTTPTVKLFDPQEDQESLLPKDVIAMGKANAEVFKRSEERAHRREVTGMDDDGQKEVALALNPPLHQVQSSEPVIPSGDMVREKDGTTKV